LNSKAPLFKIHITN